MPPTAGQAEEGMAARSGALTRESQGQGPERLHPMRELGLAGAWAHTHACVR